MKKGIYSTGKTNTGTKIVSTVQRNSGIAKPQNDAKNNDESGKSNTVEAKPQHSSLLEKLFIDLLKDTYWVETHLVEALKKMQKSATTAELQDAFEDHRFATQKHVSRLEKVFSLLGKTAEEKKCEAMEGIIKEAESMIKETKDGTMTRDVSLIISAQKAEHYEIAAYGSLVQLALTLDKGNIASILEKTLWEEEDTDRLLTDIAESSINPQADEEPAKEEYEEVETL